MQINKIINTARILVIKNMSKQKYNSFTAALQKLSNVGAVALLKTE